MFETEAQAKDFARVKVDDGLVVYAGTINPFLPRRLISSGGIAHWLAQETGREIGVAGILGDAEESEK